MGSAVQENGASTHASGSQSGLNRFSKLQLRIISAVVLIAVTLALSWIGTATFAVLIIAVAGVMIWEWGRIARGTGGDTAAILHGAATLVAIVLGVAEAIPHAFVLLVVSAAAMIFGLRLSPRAGKLSAVGILYIGLPAAFLVALRAEPQGLAAILMLFTCVWMTDTFAMVTGKAVGGPQLWPSVSPNKTWAGAIGGLVAGAVGGAAFVSVATSGDHWWYGLAVGAVLSIAAQFGDLFESAVKRAGHIKDTSELIPGHGGVLDRMDGIVGAALVLPLIMWASGATHWSVALLGG